METWWRCTGIAATRIPSRIQDWPFKPLASFALPKKSFLDDFLSFRDENETDIADSCSFSEMHSKSKVITNSIATGPPNQLARLQGCATPTCLQALILIAKDAMYSFHFVGMKRALGSCSAI